MKNIALGTALIVVSAVSSLAAQTDSAQALNSRHQLMPIPAAVQFGHGRLKIDSSFTIGVDGYTDARLQSAVHRAARRLEGRTGLEIPRVPAADLNSNPLLIRCGGPGLPVPSLQEDETYSLEVSERQAILNAPTVVGVLRGLETLLQLLESDREGYFVPAVSIQDRPRFRWRGLEIDSGRHFVPVEVIKRNIDGMAAVKLNVLHWHLTDDQGFRIECKRYPRLHEMGSDGLYYTQDQVRDIVAYAGERGIRVMPEFDMPGHATSWLVSYPEFGSAAGPYKLERQPGIFNPVLDPTNENVYRFLEDFYTEMATLFRDAYIHIGGDENEGKHWDANPQIQAFMKAKSLKSNHDLQAYFNQRLSKIIQKLGKKMIGWDEVLHPDLPRDTTVHSWRGFDSLADAARKGYDGILSKGYYIDLMYPASDHYVVDPIPVGSTLTQQEAAHILGGEATMWSEYVSPETIDSRIWPRTAAIAERFWSPAPVSDVDDMYRRLSAISLELEELGLTHIKNQRMLLRQLATGREIESFETLLSVVEPVKHYNRGKMHPTTMLSPLTSLVDAAQADARGARPLAATVDAVLSDAPHFRAYREELRLTLTRWHEAGQALAIVTAATPKLQRDEPLARDLSALGTTGLEALAYLASGVAPSTAWRDEKFAIIDQAAKPKDALEFAVIPSIRKLVVAAVELPRLKKSSVLEWKERVKTLASEEQPRSGN